MKTGKIFLPRGGESFQASAPGYLLPYFLKDIGHNLCVQSSPLVPPVFVRESQVTREVKFSA